MNPVTLKEQQENAYNVVVLHGLVSTVCEQAKETNDPELNVMSAAAARGYDFLVHSNQRLAHVLAHIPADVLEAAFAEAHACESKDATKIH